MTPIEPNPPASPKLQVSTATNSCEPCKTWSKPCPLYTKPAPPSSPPHSEWSDKDWDRDRQRDRERKEKDQVEKEQVEKQDSMQKDPEFYPPSPIYVLCYTIEVAPALADTLVLCTAMCYAS